MKIKDLNKTDLLYADIESRIDSIEAKKNTYTYLFRVSKIITFLAGASITIITGWQFNTAFIINTNNYILTASAFVTFLASVEGFLNFKDKGKSYDFLLFELRRLRDRMCYDYMCNPTAYENNRKIHFDDFQRILQSQKLIIEISDNVDN